MSKFEVNESLPKGKNYKFTSRERTRKILAKKVKLRRAQGECLGTESRRRTQRSAKSHGEAKAAFDPWISEWGNPAERSSVIML